MIDVGIVAGDAVIRTGYEYDDVPAIYQQDQLLAGQDVVIVNVGNCPVIIGGGVYFVPQ